MFLKNFREDDIYLDLSLVTPMITNSIQINADILEIMIA